jgi:hypothetical protein
MQLPRSDAPLSAVRQVNTYTVRRLIRAGLAAQAAECRAAFKAVREGQAAVEDAEDPVTESIADRDAADDQLDACTEETNRNLTARKEDAKKSAPWNVIFPEGALYYMASPVKDQRKRYGELGDRMKLHLPANDALVVNVVPRITTALAAWEVADKELGAAQTVLESKRVVRDAAEEEWRRHMDRLYSALRAERGKAEAERFFRKPASKSRKPRGEEPGGEDPADG